MLMSLILPISVAAIAACHPGEWVVVANVAEFLKAAAMMFLKAAAMMKEKISMS